MSLTYGEKIALDAAFERMLREAGIPNGLAMSLSAILDIVATSTTLASGETVHYYVDPINGSDDNDGLGLSSPIQTSGKLNLILPDFYINGSRAIVHLAGSAGFLTPGSTVQIYETNGFKIGFSDESVVHPISYRSGINGLFIPYTGHGDSTATIVSAEVINPCKTRITVSGTPGWVARDLSCLVRLLHDGTPIIHEIPVANNGVDYIDIDHSGDPDGGSVAAYFEAGDTLELIRPAVTTRSSLTGTSLGTQRFWGQGPAFNFSQADQPGSPLGGANGFGFIGITFLISIYSVGVSGLGYDRCLFAGHDHNWIGGSAYFVNCMFVDGGVAFFQNGFTTLHDQAGCLPSGETPIHGGTRDPMVDFVSKGGYILIGSGGGSSGLGFCSLTIFRGASVYDSAGGAVKPGAFMVMWGSILYIQDGAEVENGVCALQGDGNESYGVFTAWGSKVRFPTAGVDNVTGAAGDVMLGSGPGDIYTWDALRNEIGDAKSTFTQSRVSAYPF